VRQLRNWTYALAANKSQRPGIPLSSYDPRSANTRGRIKTLEDGTLMGPATDEVFMREYIKEWKRLMKAQPKLTIRREP
jgi:hypothetical protein